MNRENSTNKDLYFTKDHEWIDFQGSVAYVGVCHFKLIGFREIQQLIFNEPSNLNKQGDVIASVRYNDYRVHIHMPVDGKIVQVNESLVKGNLNVLLQHAQTNAWVALICPSQPYERKDLLLPKQYQMLPAIKMQKSSI
jgi:glycine cleavage system H protein